jgi:hypothetical protein
MNHCFENIRLEYIGERSFEETHGLLRRGDIVGIIGFPGKSKLGELSIFPSDIILLSPCLRMLPKANYGFKDQVGIITLEKKISTWKQELMFLYCRNQDIECVILT